MDFHTIHVKNQPMSFVLVGEHFWQAKLANYNPKLKRHFVVLNMMSLNFKTFEGFVFIFFKSNLEK